MTRATSPSRDGDLRQMVRRELARRHGAGHDTAVVDELAVCNARARVDIAVVNGHLAGYELKSEVDGLGRLRSQAGHYGRVFDAMTLVCAPRHLEGALTKVPGWWAVWQAEPGHELVEVRPGSANASPDAGAIAALLWREQMLELLADHGLQAGTARKPRRVLIDALVDALAPEVLRREVRERLRQRLLAQLR